MAAIEEILGNPGAPIAESGIGRALAEIQNIITLYDDSGQHTFWADKLSEASLILGNIVLDLLECLNLIEKEQVDG